MQYFQELARTENITKAAENLHVSQPAISAMLKRLETELGMELFERQGRSIRLNENGKSFYRSVSSILEIIEQNRKNILLYGKEQPKEISVGILCSEAPLLSLIDGYIKLYPDIFFRLYSNRASISRLGIANLDFYLDRHPKHMKNLASIPLLSSVTAPAYLLVPRNHYLCREPYLTVEMLANHLNESHNHVEHLSYVQTMPTSFAEPEELLLLRANGVNPSIRVITDDRFTMLSLISQNGMITVIPAADKAVASSMENIVAIPLYSEQVTPPEMRQYYFAWDPNKLTAQARAFLEYVMTLGGVEEKDIHYPNDTTVAPR